MEFDFLTLSNYLTALFLGGGGGPDPQVGATDLESTWKLNFDVINSDFLVIEVTLPEVCVRRAIHLHLKNGAIAPSIAGRVSRYGKICDF